MTTVSFSLETDGETCGASKNSDYAHDGDLYSVPRTAQRGETVLTLLWRRAAWPILEDHPDLPSEQLRERVLRDIAAFVGGAAQHDDMTMILVKIDPASA